MTDSWSVEEVVGRRIRQRREHFGWTQEELGKRLGEFLAKEWPRQAIYEAERGMRGLPVVELAAFARVLEVPLGWLVGPVEGEVMRFPSGQTFDVAQWRPATDDRYVKTLDQAILVAQLGKAAHLIMEGLVASQDGLREIYGLMGEADAILEREEE